MVGRPPDDPGLLGGVRRAVGGAFDATVGRVGQSMGDAALEITGATAQQVIEELEPYLIEEAVPRIVSGITPYLADRVVPEVLDAITEHLTSETIPEIVDGVTGHLVAVTVPRVVEGATPRLVDMLIPRLLDDLRPYLEKELVPSIVAGVLPYLSEEVAPQLVDALLPKISEEVAPQLVDALMPKISEEVAPQLVDALMPKISEEVAPQLVDALLPKIRHEVVPTILDDIVDDPKVRELIREQSQGLFLDMLEALRENLADADDIAEGIGRRLLLRKPRTMPPTSLSMVLDATGDSVAAGDIDAAATMSERRAEWDRQPLSLAPPGREFAYAGVATRAVALILDTSLAGWLASQGLSAILNLVDRLLPDVGDWLAILLTGITFSLVPVYLATCWWLVGRTLGSWLVGTRVCMPDGRKLAFVRAFVRAFLALGGLFVWLLTGAVSLFDARRRTLLDRILRTEVRYVVPADQQHRYMREAWLKRGEERPTAGPA